MLIRENLDASSTAEAVRLTAAFPVEVEALARVYRGTKISEFIDLQPWATVQRIAVDAAKKWIRHMALQGYELDGNETDIRLWGPYRPKAKLYGDTATSYMESENPFPDGKAKMLLRGNFIARRQRLVEHG